MNEEQKELLGRLFNVQDRLLEGALAASPDWESTENDGHNPPARFYLGYLRECLQHCNRALLIAGDKLTKKDKTRMALAQLRGEQNERLWFDNPDHPDVTRFLKVLLLSRQCTLLYKDLCDDGRPIPVPSQDTKRRL